MHRRWASVFLLLMAGASWATVGEAVPPRAAQNDYVRALLLEKSGGYAEAFSAYEKAMALDPKSALLAGEAAELALGLGNRAKAEALARRRLALAPEDPSSHLILGRVLWAGGDLRGAEAEFDRALSTGGAPEGALFEVIELAAGRDPAKARVLLEHYLAGHPADAARAYFELGRLDAQEEHWPKAEQELKRSIALDDAESGPARLTLAQVYEVTGATRAALAQYQRLLLEEPGDQELWARIGFLQDAAGEHESAAATFHALKSRHPDDPAACAWLAGQAERAGDFKAAAAALKDSAALKEDATLDLRLGYYQVQGGDAKSAMSTLLDARRRWPKDDRVAYYLALGLDDQGGHEQAVKLLREVLVLKPADHDARWQLATILEKMNRWEEAEPELRRLLADKPNDAAVLNYLGFSLADRGLKLDEARTLIQKALTVEPANAAYLDSLGWVDFKLGRSTQAVQELAASIRALSDDDEVWDHLGDALNLQARFKPAWQAWRRAQSLGRAKAGAEADALEKTWSATERGELWRAHLSVMHGGVKRFAGVCGLEGRVMGRDVSFRALMDFRAPKTLSVDLLGPMMTPIAHAALDSRGFMMDPVSIEGVPEEQIRAAAEQALSAVADVLGAEPFAPGPARLRSGWWGYKTLERPAWRVRLNKKSALAEFVAPAASSVRIRLTEFQAQGASRIPRSLTIKGRFWELNFSCAQPKLDIGSNDPIPDIP